MSSITEKPKPLNAFEYYIVCWLAKSAAVTGFQPYLYLKNSKQALATENAVKPIKIQWSKLYHGVGPNYLNAFLFAGMGAINGGVKNWMSGGDHSKLTQMQMLGISIGASAIGCIPWCGLDLAILQTQLRNKEAPKKISPLQICREMYRERGWKFLFRGLIPTFGREMPFGVSLLYCGPALDSYINTKLQDKVENEYVRKMISKIGSSTGVGFAMAGGTQWVDVIKTTVQKDWNAKKYAGSIDAINAIHAKGGLGAFFTGLSHRLKIVVIANLVINVTTEVLTKAIQKHKA